MMPHSRSSAATTAREFMVDAKGRHVPVELVKPIDQARDQLVSEMVAKARKMHADLAAFKQHILADLAAFLELSAERYQVSLGGAKGNLTLHSFDGNLRVCRQVADRVMFTEALQVAKQLIDECVRDWASDSRPEVRALIEDAFQSDREGKISTERVLRLRKLDIQDARWQRAMSAITDSITIASTTTYVRFYERRAGQWLPIVLDLAAVPVTDEVTP